MSAAGQASSEARKAPPVSCIRGCGGAVQSFLLGGVPAGALIRRGADAQEASVAARLC